MATNDPDLIFQSAKQFVGDPLLQMEQAHQLVQGRCKVSPIAFGVVGMGLLSGPYEEARSYAEKNLGDGVDKVRETGEKLADVAQKWGQVDAHNAIMLLANPTPPALPPLQSHGAPQSSEMIAGGGMLSTAVILMLIARNSMAATTLVMCKELEIVAAVSGVIWALFLPDEGSLNTAVDSWNNANSSLVACGNAVTAAVGPATKGWTGDDRNAFDQYIVALKNDINDAAVGSKTNADALLKIVEQLNDTQTTFIEMILLTMFTMAALAVISMLPGPWSAPAALTKKIMGFELNAATAEVLVGVYQTINEGIKPVKDWWAGADLLFARARGSAPTTGSPSGDTFASVKIDWAK